MYDWRQGLYGLRAIVRRDADESYRQILLRMAKESGIEAPTTDDLVRLDRQRKDKSLLNKDWRSPDDPEAKVAKMKEGRTHLAYKSEHAVDLDSGAVIAAEIHDADQGDTTTLDKTLKVAEDNLEQVSKIPPRPDAPVDLLADNGYFPVTCSRIWTANRGAVGLASPSGKASMSGTAITKRGAP